MRWPRQPTEPADARTGLAMLRLFYEQSGISLIAGSLLMPLQTGYAWSRAELALVVLWAVCIGAVLLLRLQWRHSAQRLDDAALAASAPRWQARAMAGAGLTGLLWSAAMAMVFSADEPSTQMYVAMLASITCVSSINVMAPQPRAFALLLAPMALTLTALFASLGTLAGGYCALLVLAAAGLAAGLVRRHVRLLRQSHALRFEREALLAQTQAARDAQTRFLAAASHDLRQPVHALGLLAAQIEVELRGAAAPTIDAADSAATSRDAAAALTRAGASAAQLQGMAQALDSLVETLLDVSRLDGGAVVPVLSAIPLTPLFDRLAAEFAVLADERGLQWRLRPTALWVHSDEAQLERLLRNLLSNAMTHTVSGGVLLAAQRRGGGVRLAVWDTGPGIAPEHQARIWDEFVQLANPGRDRRRGHGLGLSIVARIARLLGTAVELRSRSSRGSCFWLVLPSAAAPAARAAAPAASLQLPLHGKRVALVEDDAAVALATAALLRAWGCEVWADVAVAPLLQRLQAAGVRPDCIVSDWRLEHGDGIAAIAALRGWAGQALPALLISGETLPLQPQQLVALCITSARKPLPAPALRAWLSAPALPQPTRIDLT